MPQLIPIILRTLNSPRVQRAAVVLAIGIVIVISLVKFPGPVFRSSAEFPFYSRQQLIHTLPMDADEQTIELHKHAAAALATLVAKRISPVIREP